MTPGWAGIVDVDTDLRCERSADCALVSKRLDQDDGHHVIIKTD